MSSIYTINKGINKSIEFKGLKAQYIGYMGAGLLVLLIFFALLYIGGLNPFICLGIVAVSGTLLLTHIYRLSHTYGPYGMMKKLASRSIPKVVRGGSRKIFILNKKSDHEKKPG